MKKATIILIISLCITINLNGQIPNQGFEDWTAVGNCIEPTGWHSFYYLVDSTGNYCPVTRSTDHYPELVGSYSARIANDTTIWNTGIEPGRFLGWGMLITTKFNDKPLFPITGHPTSLCGYYKFLPENGDTMNINIFLSENGTEVSAGHLESNISTPNWTSFIIPFTSYTNADSARITLSAAAEPKNGIGVLGNSVLYIDNLSFDVLITSVTEKPADRIPETYVLSQNYPNPFNPVTTIQFSLPKPGKISLKIFNLLGEEVATLVSGQLPAGSYTYEWDGSNMASGIYLYRWSVGSLPGEAEAPSPGSGQSFVETRKMVLMQ
jgi:hypothetical protein